MYHKADGADVFLTNLCCGECSEPLQMHPAGSWSGGGSCDYVNPNEFSPCGNIIRSYEELYGCKNMYRSGVRNDTSCNWGMCRSCWEEYGSKATTVSGKVLEVQNFYCGRLLASGNFSHHKLSFKLCSVENQCKPCKVANSGKFNRDGVPIESMDLSNLIIKCRDCKSDVQHRYKRCLNIYMCVCVCVCFTLCNLHSIFKS